MLSPSKPFSVRPRIPRSLALAILGLLGAAPSVVAQDQPRITIEAPNKWAQMPPLAVDRGACREYWVAERPALPKRDLVRPHTPNVRILVFNGENKPDGQTFLAEPFVDYEDYVARGYGSEGVVSAREPMEIGDVEGTRFTAEVEDVALALLGVAFPLPNGGEGAVVFAVLRERLDDFKRDIARTLTSIQITSDGETPLQAPWIADPEAWSKADVAARSELIEPFAKALVEAAEEDPGRGWKPVKSKRWTALTRASSKDTKRAMQAADAIGDWIDEHLNGVGDGAAHPEVIRIYASPAELATIQASRVNPRNWDPATRTIHFAVDPNAGTGFGYGPLLQGMVWNHIDDHVPGSMYGAPRWLGHGLDEYLRSTRVNKNKLEFFPDAVETGRLTYNRDNDAMPDIWGLIQELNQPEPKDGDQEPENSRVWDYAPESARLMRWLFEHNGSAAFDSKDILADYLNELGKVLVEHGANPIPEISSARFADGPEARQARKQYFAWRASIRDTTNSRVMPSTDDAWMALNAKWRAFVDED